MAETGEAEDEQKGGGKEVIIKLPSWLLFPAFFKNREKCSKGWQRQEKCLKASQQCSQTS